MKLPPPNMGAHPNSSDVRAFAVACQIDPSFDTKYIPMIAAACEGELPPTWISVIDPSDKWYFCTHFKPVVKKYLEDNPHSPPAVALAASGGKRPKSLSVWEHPSVPALRDEVQELIAEDEKQERLAMEALNPIDPEEARLKKIKMGKRQIIKSVEVVVLDAKAMYGSPDVDDVVCDSSHDGFFTCDPEDFLFACDALMIPLPPETGYHDSLLWPARMCALTPLPDNWTRGPDLPRAEDGTVKRQYRCDEWENEEMYVARRRRDASAKEVQFLTLSKCFCRSPYLRDLTPTAGTSMSRRCSSTGGMWSSRRGWSWARKGKRRGRTGLGMTWGCRSG